MKKIVVIFLLLALSLPLFGCRGTTDPVKPAETDTQTVTETETAIETETETEKETETETEAETEEEPKTDEERVDVIVEAIASGDNSDQNWDTLHSFGDVAFDHLVKRYFGGETNAKIKSVISVFVSETVKDETTKFSNSYFSGLEFPDRTALGDSRKSLYVWLSTFKIKAKNYAKYVHEQEAKSKLPYTCRMLLLTGEDPFLYDPTGVDISVLLDKVISENFSSQNASHIYNYLTRTHRYTAFQYCVDNYFTETDAMRRTAMSWIAYEILYPEISSLLGQDRAVSIYRGTENYDAAKKWDIKAHADTVGPFIGKYTEEVKDTAENMLEDEVRDEYPFTYALLCAVGFDAYKPGEPDIAFRSRKVIKAAAELYQAVTYGWVPDELTESCLPVEYYMRQELTERTKNDVYHYCPEEVFYNYFEKYMDRSIIDNACKTQNAWFTIKSGRVYMFDGGPQSSLSIDHRSAKLSKQSGDTYVITADVHFPSAMMGFTKNLTFEVKEDGGGMRLTGGVFAEKLLSQCRSASVAASNVIGSYCILREGQPEYNNIANILGYGGPYDSIDQVPKEYRDRVDADAEFPVYLTLSEEKDFALLKSSATEEIYNELTRAYGAYDGDMAVYPKYAKTKTTPAFEHGFTYVFDAEGNTGGEFITTYDVLLAMNVIDAADDVITFSLDFIREENGVKNNVTYTFEVKTNILTGNDINEYYTYVSKVTGGTFVTDVIFGN
ncbi:MAG: hypothetical protein IKH51_10830 [Clostridia bacterium]|nr:hypothetical protein [Clostridia bacterium]